MLFGKLILLILQTFVFRLWHTATPFGTFIFFCFAFFCDSCTPPADRLLFLHIKCFLLSQVSCCSCTSGAPPIAELQEIAKQRMSKVQNENGVMPLPNSNRPRSKQHPMRRPKWRYATAEQQKSICHLPNKQQFYSPIDRTTRKPMLIP